MMVTVGLLQGRGVWPRVVVGSSDPAGSNLGAYRPVLASDVQIENPNDRDRLRFGLTGEAGLNDGPRVSIYHVRPRIVGRT